MRASYHSKTIFPVWLGFVKRLEVQMQERLLKHGDLFCCSIFLSMRMKVFFGMGIGIVKHFPYFIHGNI